MSDWVATDLDGTLFARGWAAEDAVPATWRVDVECDEPIASSWMPSGIHRAMVILQRESTLVPVTARDAESFARVRIEGLSLSGPAVLANGALIYGHGGRLDANWESEMIRRLSPRRQWMDDVLARLSERTAGHARTRLVAGPAGLPAYLVAKAPKAWWRSEAGMEIMRTFDWGDGRLSILGDELQILPPGVGKAEALAEVMDRYFAGKRPLFCFGDMPSDLDFMRLGGILATPRHSALEVAWPRR